jgi:hypothetical protein
MQKRKGKALLPHTLKGPTQTYSGIFVPPYGGLKIKPNLSHKNPMAFLFLHHKITLTESEGYLMVQKRKGGEPPPLESLGRDAPLWGRYAPSPPL